MANLDLAAARRQVLRLAARALEQRLTADTGDNEGPQATFTKRERIECEQCLATPRPRPIRRKLVVHTKNSIS